MGLLVLREYDQGWWDKGVQKSRWSWRSSSHVFVMDRIMTSLSFTCWSLYSSMATFGERASMELIKIKWGLRSGYGQNKVGILIKRGNSSNFSIWNILEEEFACCNPAEHCRGSDIMISDFPGPEHWENEFLFLNLPSHILLWQSEQTRPIAS